MLTTVIDTLRVVYQENPEFKYATMLIKTLEMNGITVTADIKMYCQSCVVACNIMTSCLSIAFLELRCHP